MNQVRKLIKHSYQVKFIKRSTGVVFSCPFIMGSYLNQLCEIGEFEITVPNGWVKDTENNTNKLTRDVISAYDVVQIYRDFSVVFSGVVLQIKRNMATLTIKGKSEAWLLTKQYTGVETYTEEPATTLKRYLKGWDYKIKDNFNRTTGLGASWTLGGNRNWVISSNKLFTDPFLPGANDYALAVHTTTLTAAEWNDSVIEFDINTITQAAGASLEFYCVFSRASSTDNRLLYILWDKPGLDTTFILGKNEVSGGGTVYATAFKTGIWTGNVKIVNRGLYVDLYLDNVLIMTATYVDATVASDFRFRAIAAALTNEITIDNVQVKTKKQLITEGTISTFGSSKTTTVSYETLHNAINERIRRQLASTAAGVTWWEWKENPVAYAGATTPCANMDFKNRIGSDKAIELSVEEKNLKTFESEESWESFVTDILALGAGTAAIDSAGQNMVRASDFDAYDTSGFILESLYQLSEEQTLATLKSLASLWLTRRTTYHENIKVDPVDYESKGFDVGDSYLLKIPALKFDGTTYYRIINERRDFSPEGAETVTVNWKDKTRSFWNALRDELRQQKSKARYDQGTYVVQNYNYSTVSSSIANNAYTTVNKEVRFSTELYSGVKSVIWNFNMSVGNATKVYIDSVDRTNDLFGATTITTDKLNVDITRFITTIGNHTVEMQNVSGGTITMIHWGDVELYTV